MGTVFGVDTRGSIVDEYQQRNALVVGFMMGFAIIPIIYTIADDALSSVPDTLRSASLGCGALAVANRLESHCTNGDVRNFLSNHGWPWPRRW